MMSLSWSSMAVLCVIALISLAVYRRCFSPISDVPGPFWASVTRIWFLTQVLGGHQNVCISKLHEKYGPFVRIAPNEISVCHPEAPKKLLLAHIKKGPWYKVTAVPDWRFQSPFSILDPKEKMQKTKNLAQGYAHTNILQSEYLMDATFSQLMDWMDKYAEEGKPMELNKWFTYAAADVVGEVVFSRPFGFLREGRDIGGSLAMTEKVHAYVAVAGFLLWVHYTLTNPIITWLGILPIGHLFVTANQVIAERRNNPDAHVDALAYWYKALRDHRDRMTFRDIEAAVTSAIAAAGDTTSCALQSIVYHMMRHPEAWQRARKEIRDVQAEGRCLDRVVSFGDAQRLPYLEACIKEAMRVFGPNGMGLQRVAPEEGLQIGDCTFPAGTILSIHPYTMMRDKECWGPDAEEFNPDRWFADDIAEREQYWMVWSQGYASCPGQHIAKTELWKLVATLVRDYDIRLVNPNQEWKFKAFFSVFPRCWPVYVEKCRN